MKLLHPKFGQICQMLMKLHKHQLLLVGGGELFQKVKKGQKSMNNKLVKVLLDLEGSTLSYANKDRIIIVLVDAAQHVFPSLDVLG